MDNIVTTLAPLFFLTAILYATVGFGGGSTYLALLALAGVAYRLLPSTALICNIIVVSSGCYFFVKERHLSLKAVLPFLVTSIPLAYVGGRLMVGKTAFLILLGIALFIAAMRMFLDDRKFQKVKALSWGEALRFGLPIGAVLGFLSGITGIGGGIYLAPVLYFLGWAPSKTVAASASVFILLNSAAGLAGQLVKNSFVVEWHLVAPLALVVFLGGQIGSRLGSKRLSLFVVQRLTAVLILFVSLRILWQVALP